MPAGRFGRLRGDRALTDPSPGRSHRGRADGRRAHPRVAPSDSTSARCRTRWVAGPILEFARRSRFSSDNINDNGGFPEKLRLNVRVGLSTEYVTNIRFKYKGPPFRFNFRKIGCESTARTKASESAPTSSTNFLQWSKKT